MGAILSLWLEENWWVQECWWKPQTGSWRQVFIFPCSLKEDKENLQCDHVTHFVSLLVADLKETNGYL